MMQRVPHRDGTCARQPASGCVISVSFVPENETGTHQTR